MTLWEKPIASSLVAAMSAEELRLYNQVPTEIILEISDGTTASNVGEVDNAIYFTREQFFVGIRLPVSSLVN